MKDTTAFTSALAESDPEIFGAMTKELAASVMKSN